MNNNQEKRRIAVAGAGYVGMSLGALLAQRNRVTIVEPVGAKVAMINAGQSPIVDADITALLESGALDLHATSDARAAYADAEFVVIAVPTNYDTELAYFNTAHVEDVVRVVSEVNPSATMIIKSTIPIGYTKGLRERTGARVIFSPEFLREGRALHDNLYPSRIIVGHDAELEAEAREYAGLVADGARETCPVLFMGSTEAEAVKLFANAYLALRVAYFNELDSFAEACGLNAGQIIDGVTYDARIGRGYCNPSFGYGGYCFPKDTKQLLADFDGEGVAQRTIAAVVDANRVRKRTVANNIIKRLHSLTVTDSPYRRGGTVGIYRLAMKSGSDNSRESAVWDIIDELSEKGYGIFIYEPSCVSKAVSCDYPVTADLARFKVESDIIIANRFNAEDLGDVVAKVYTRDVYGDN